MGQRLGVKVLKIGGRQTSEAVTAWNYTSVKYDSHAHHLLLAHFDLIIEYFAFCCKACVIQQCCSQTQKGALCSLLFEDAGRGLSEC